MHTGNGEGNLEDFGTVPEDIRSHILAEEDTEVLRKWHKAAARAGSFCDFRERMKEYREK